MIVATRSYFKSILDTIEEAIMNNILAIFVGSMLTFFSGVQEPVSESSYVVPNYSCQDPVWTEPAQLIENDDYFTGALEANCTFETIAGVGYVGLKNSLIERLIAGAQKIHAGPEETVYEGMPNIRYDATIDLEEISQEDKLTVRGDINIATNETDRLVQAIISKKVTGKGEAEYMRKMDVGYDITSAHRNNMYNIRITSSTLVERPWYAPAGMFLSTCIERSKEGIVNSEEKVITYIANNL